MKRAPTTPVGGVHDLAIEFAPVAAQLRKFRDRDPQKTALVDLDQDVSITFGGLHDVVNRIARFLIARGVERGDRVGLLSGECIEKLLIWLALWRIGAVVCPLNVEMNISYVAELLQTIGPKMTLWQRGLDGATMTEGVAGDILCFGRWDPDGVHDKTGDEVFGVLDTNVDAPEPEMENGPDDVACIYCTSGTTTRPKLVVCDHISYWLFGLSAIEQVGLTEEDRTLEYRSFGWNSAQGMSLMPWLELGCTLHMAKRFSHGRFFDWVRAHGITFSVGIPTVINMLVERPVGVIAADVPTLRLMSCSTAPLTPERWQRFEDMYGITLLQMYGSSEGGWVCANRHYMRKMGTVGPPAKHQEFQIVDADGNPCPPGIEGEVTVGGPQCCMATIADDGTWETVKGTRIHMGDLAVMDEDGFVTITGRLKDLIIRGGVNVSPMEIDNVLLTHAKVLDAAAVGVPDPIYGEEVVCYVVPRPGETLSEDEITAHCAATLPQYRMPKQVWFVDALPKNDRGKVRREALRERWLAEHAKA